MDGYLLLVADRAGGVDPASCEVVEATLSATASVRRVGMAGPRDLAAALDGLDGRVPVVVGGDGALHHVVTAMDARGLLGSRPVGWVPMGTANDLARSTGVPLDPVAAARRIADGQEATLSLGHGDLGLVCNAAHAGVGVSAAQTAGQLKRRFNGHLGKLAYRLGSLSAGVSTSAESVTVRVDGQVVWDGPALLVGVGVGRTIGGGQPLFADADPADRVLDVVVAGPRGPLGRAGLAGAVARGRHAQLPDTTTARGREVGVVGTARRWNVDGELVDAASSVTVALRPAAWRLLGAAAPRPA